MRFFSSRFLPQSENFLCCFALGITSVLFGQREQNKPCHTARERIVSDAFGRGKKRAEAR